MKEFLENYKGDVGKREKEAAYYIAKKLGSHWNNKRECILNLENNTIKVTSEYNPTPEHPQGYEQIIWEKKTNDFVPVFSTYNIYQLAREVIKRASTDLSQTGQV